jgi:hypothetical protein
MTEVGYCYLAYVFYELHHNMSRQSLEFVDDYVWFVREFNLEQHRLFVARK